MLGWGLGIALLLPPILLLFYLDIRLPDPNTPILHAHTSSKLLAILLIALLVASLEEFIFRLWLLDLLRSKTTESLAIITSAAYFSLLHFLKAPAAAFHQPVTIADGWMALLSSYSQLLKFEYPGTMLALFLAGCLLALIKLRYRSLLLVIGIHTGWIFCIKTTKVFSNSNPATLKVDFLVGQDGIIGYLTAGWLCLILICLMIYQTTSPNQASK
jgi:membrane protease YdiL (CAAX protease family)